MHNKYPEVKQLNLPAIDQKILKYWEEQNVFNQIQELRKDAPKFVFYDGPPSANGMPGIHHILSRTLKDVFCRYHSMLGKNVPRRAGWDTHGLPIEISVEKNLNIRKEDIGNKISIEDYNKACREQVLMYKDKWDISTILMGYWVDLNDPYITFENYYIETLWHLLKKLYDKKLLYKGHTIQPYSPAAGTGLSSHELNQTDTYKLVKDTAVTVLFNVIKTESSKNEILNIKIQEGNVYIMSWTTTPWTLPSNTGLTVGADIMYSLIHTFNPYTGMSQKLICASDLISKYFKPDDANLSFDEYIIGDKNIPYKIITTFLGKEIEGIHYHPIFDYAQPEDMDLSKGGSFRVICGDFITTNDGTGVVHTAPCFGSDDMRMHKIHGIGTLCLVDKRARFLASVKNYANEYVKEAYYTPEEKEIERIKQKRDKYLSVDERIAIQLKIENKAFRIEKYEHSYPHCWRTDKPILYYPLDSWFIHTTKYKERMIELNETIQWKPESIGTGRFGKWLENLQDWNLSRSRFWGTPLPIWRTEDGQEEICIGNISQLISLLHEESPEKEILDLHKPYIDNVILKSPSGKKMYREPDLIDVWFDSGAMPYAQHRNFIQEIESLLLNKEDRALFPADFIAEGVDQTRGWFYTLHALSVMLYDSIAYKTVISNGHVVDKNGIKMSKRLGNVIDPIATINTYGADATRWYLMSASQPWDSLRFDINGIGEVQRKLFGTLHNTYSFFSLYANIDNFRFEEKYIEIKIRPEIDQWIISMLASLTQTVNESFVHYELTKAVRAIEVFVDEHLSNWYVRLCRRRFWKGEYEQDKICAYQTLYECLETLTLLMAPVAPFFSEYLFDNLNQVSMRYKTNSIHKLLFPISDQNKINKKLEKRMQRAQDICSMVLSLRKKSNIKVRQPLQKIFIPILDPTQQEQIEEVKELIQNEVNVKEIIFISEDDNIIRKKIKPNYKTLGSKLGSDMKSVAQLINQMSQQDIRSIETNKKIILKNDILSKSFEIGIEDVDITSEDIPGMLVASYHDNTVALDTTITPELKLEGDSRELVNRIQNLRKLKSFNVLDKIDLYVEKHIEINDVINKNSIYICNETLTNKIYLEDKLENDYEEVILNDIKIKIKISLNPS